MKIIRNPLLKQLLAVLEVKNRSRLARALGTAPSTITEMEQGRGGKTFINSCRLIKELADALPSAEVRKAVSAASKQYKKDNRRNQTS